MGFNRSSHFQLYGGSMKDMSAPRSKYCSKTVDRGSFSDTLLWTRICSHCIDSLDWFINYKSNFFSSLSPFHIRKMIFRCPSKKNVPNFFLLFRKFLLKKIICQWKTTTSTSRHSKIRTGKFCPRCLRLRFWSTEIPQFLHGDKQVTAPLKCSLG